MNKHDILKIIDSYDSDRVFIELYNKNGESHLKGKINFKEGTLGFMFDFIVDYKSEEQIRERIDKCILNAFYLYEE